LLLAGRASRLYAFGSRDGDYSCAADVDSTKYQLIANVKAAQVIGLILPPSPLLGADEVIE
jgi:hypothetical protein